MMDWALSAFPLLLRPKALALKNYWQRRAGDRTLVIRDAVVIAFGIGVMLGIYYGGLWVLDQMQAERALVYFHPSIPLGLILVYLFLMLVLSNAAAAVASLYLSNDLDLILSSPIKPSRFFWGKFLDILFSSSWITMIFILPAVYSFARYFHAPPSYYFVTLAVLLPYFVIPTALSMVFVTLYSRLVPASRTREVLFVLAVLGIAGTYAVVKLLFPSSGEAFSFKNLDDVLRLVSILSIPNTQWAPPYWASTCLSEMLSPTKASYVPHLILLYSVAAFSLALSFVVLRLMHFEAYSKALSNRKTATVDSRRSQERLKKYLSFCSPPTRAQIAKEWKMFARDVTQLFQLLLLSGICVLYFYNFRIIHGIQAELPEQTRKWWGIFIFMINTYIEAFLITAVGTRFVFQSVSLEGRSFWIMQSSPVSLKEFLRTKLVCWFFPVALVLGCVFAAGAHAVGAPAYLVVLKMVSSWIMCYGIVGLGIGLGAYYANFSWEHTTQLAASFGSLVYMLACVGLVSLDLGIIGLVLVFQHLYDTTAYFGLVEYVLGASSAAALLIYLNLGVTRWSLGFGERELVRRME